MESVQSFLRGGNVHGTFLYGYLRMLSNFSILSSLNVKDEIFHVEQAKVVCSHDYSTWNPKITTLPGLYYISYIVHTLFLQLYPRLNCSINFLRSLNCAIGFGQLFVLVYIRQLVSYELPTMMRPL